MPQVVNVEGIGTVEFPEGFNEQQIIQALNTDPTFAPMRVSGAGLRGSGPRQDQLALEQAVPSQAAVDQPRAIDTLSDSLASLGRGAASMVRAPFAALGAVERQLPQEVPRPFGTASDWMKGKIDDLFPFTPQAGQSWPSLVGMAAGGGVGSMAGLLGTGLLGLPSKGVQALGATAEGVDAYEAELRRQDQAGEPRNHAKALAKGLGYGALTYPIERFGAPRILENAASRATRLGVMPALRRGVIEAGVNAGQESVESALQGLIVNGRIDPQDMLLSAIGGVFAGGPFGAASEFAAQGNSRALAEQIAAVRGPASQARLELAGIQRDLQGRTPTPDEEDGIRARVRLVLAEERLAQQIGAARDESLSRRVLEQLKLGEALGPNEAERLAMLMADGRAMAEAEDFAQRIAEGEDATFTREARESWDQWLQNEAGRRSARLSDFNRQLDQLLAVPKRRDPEPPEDLTLIDDVGQPLRSRAERWANQFIAVDNVFPVTLMQRAKRMANTPPMVREAMVRMAQMYPIAEEQKSPLYRETFLQGPEAWRQTYQFRTPYDPAGFSGSVAPGTPGFTQPSAPSSLDPQWTSKMEWETAFDAARRRRVYAQREAEGVIPGEQTALPTVPVPKLFTGAQTGTTAVSEPRLQQTGVPNDQEIKRRLRGEKPGGQKPRRPVPVKKEGGAAPPSGRVLQTPKQAPKLKGTAAPTVKAKTAAKLKGVKTGAKKVRVAAQKVAAAPPSAEDVTGFSADELEAATEGIEPTTVAPVPARATRPAKPLRGAKPTKATPVKKAAAPAKGTEVFRDMRGLSVEDVTNHLGIAPGELARVAALVDTYNQGKTDPNSPLHPLDAIAGALGLSFEQASNLAIRDSKERIASELTNPDLRLINFGRRVADARGTPVGKKTRAPTNLKGAAPSKVRIVPESEAPPLPVKAPKTEPLSEEAQIAVLAKQTGRDPGGLIRMSNLLYNIFDPGKRAQAGFNIATAASNFSEISGLSPQAAKQLIYDIQGSGGSTMGRPQLAAEIVKRLSPTAQKKSEEGEVGASTSEKTASAETETSISQPDRPSGQILPFATEVAMALDALGVKIKYSNRFEYAGIQFTDSGDIILHLSPEGMGRLNAEEQAVTLIEEEIHAAQYAMLRDMWDKGGRIGNVLTFVNAYLSDLAKDISPELRSSIISVYGNPKISEQNMVLEYLRQLVQQSRTGKITEQYIGGLTGKIRAFIQNLIAFLKGLANPSPTIKAWVDDLNRVLDIAEGKKVGPKLGVPTTQINGTGASTEAAASPAFRKRAEVEAAMNRTGVSPQDQSQIHEAAAAQRQMFDESTLTVIDQMRDTSAPVTDQLAARLLNPIVQVATAGETSTPIDALPEAEQESAAGRVIDADRFVNRHRANLFAGYLADDKRLEALMGNLPKWSEAMAAAQFYDKLRRELPRGYQAYLVNVARGGWAPASAAAAAERLLAVAAGRANKTLIDSGTIINLLNQIAADPRVVIGPDTTNRELLEQVNKLGGWHDENVESLGFLLNGGPGNLAPALVRIPNLGRKIRTIRMLRDEGEGSLKQALLFANDFHNSPESSGVVTPGQFARRLESYIKTHREQSDVAQELFGEMERAYNWALAKKKAVEVIDSGITSRPQYQEQLAKAAKKVDAVDAGMFKFEPTSGAYIFTNPNADANGEKLELSLRPTREDFNTYTANSRKAISEINRFLATPGIDPIQKRSAERARMQLSLWFQLQANSPERVTRTGRLLHRWFRKLPWTKVPQNLISEVGGHTSNHAQRMSLAVSYMGRKMQAIAENETYGDKAFENAQAKAVIAHGLSKDGTRVAPEELLAYLEQIYEPLAAHRQAYGDQAMNVGSTTIFHHKILKEDMDLLKLHKDHTEAVRDVGEDQLEKFGMPTRIEESTGPIRKLWRKGISDGADVVPRRWSPESERLAEPTNWQVWDGPTRADYIWSDQNFIRTVMSFVDTTTPEYKRGTKYDAAFDRLALKIRDDTVTIRNRADLFNAMADIVSNSDPTFDRTEFDADLNHEITLRLSNSIDALVRDIQTERARVNQSAAKPAVLAGQETFTGTWRPLRRMIMESLRTEGSFINPRGRMLAPNSFYQYSQPTWPSRAGYRANLANVTKVNFLDSLEAMAVAMNQTVEKIRDELIRKVGPNVSREEREKASREMKNLGDLRFGLAETKEMEENFRTVITQLDTAMRQELTDRPIMELARSTNQALQLSLLGTFGSQFTNMYGGLLLGQQVLDTQIGKLQDILGGGAVKTAYRFLPETFQFALNQAKRSNHWSYHFLKPVEGVLKSMMPGIAKSLDRQARMIERGRKSALLSSFDAAGRAENRMYYGPEGATLPEEEPATRIEKLARSITNNRFYDMFQRYVPRMADQLVNVGRAQRDAERIFELQTYADRIRASRPGVLDPSDPSQEIKPEEIELGPSQMGHLREYLNPMGGLENLMFSFINRREAAAPADRNNVEMLNDEQMDTWLQTTAQLGNVIGDTNSPSAANTSIGAGIAMTFMRWPIQMADQIFKTFSALKATPGGAGGDWKRQLGLLLGSMLVLILAGLPFYEAKLTANSIFSGKSASQTRLANVLADPISLDALRYGMVSTGAMVPYIGNIADRAFGGASARPLMDLSQIIPLAGLSAGVADTAIRAFRGGDVRGAIGDFTGRWIPITQPALSRMPYFAEQTDIQNALRSGRASVPLAQEIRRPGGGNVRPSPLTGNYRAIEGAAYRGDVAGVREGFNNAVQKQMRLRGVDQREAERQVQSALRSRTVETRLFPSKLTDLERQRWEQRMTGSQAADIAKARRAEALVADTVLTGAKAGRSQRRLRARDLRPKRPRAARAARAGRRLRGVASSSRSGRRPNDPFAQGRQQRVRGTSFPSFA